MLNQITALASLSLGFVFLALSRIFSNLIPLSQGFQRRSILMLIGASALFVIGFFLKPKKWTKLAKATAVSVGLAWLLLNCAIYFNQDRLLFSPRGFSETKRLRIASEYPESKELYLEVDDGVKLQGWYIPTDNNVEIAPLVLVFPGQGGEASSYLRLSKEIPEFSWAFFNYRGYGLSHGKPSDEVFFRDALALFDFFVEQPYVDSQNIFALGGSLGTGVAAYLACHRKLRGIALFSPYDKIGGGVAQDLIPFLPTALLIRSGFNIIDFAPKAQTPLLAIIGEQDLVITPARSELLVSAWGSETQVKRLVQGDHYNIYESKASWNVIRDFFFSLL